MSRIPLFLFFVLFISGALAHNAEDHSSRSSQEILDAHADTLIEYDLDDDGAIDADELGEAFSDWQDEDIGPVALDAVEAAYTKGIDLSELDEEDSNSNRPELDGNWASVGDEKKFRLGFFAGRSFALVNPLDDGGIKVTHPGNDQSIEVEPGEIGDASDIYGNPITDNIFANCGYVQKGNSKFAQNKINFYYGENGGGSTEAMERRIEDELASCESYRADITSKNVNFGERSQYTLYFRPGTSVDGTEESYVLNTGSRSQDIVFAGQVGGIGHIGIRPDIGDKFIPDWSTGEEIRIDEGIYAQLGEAKYDSEDERYFSAKLYKRSKKEEIVQRDLNWVGRVIQDRDRQPEQLVINEENTYIWIDESGDLMRDDRVIVDNINDRCNQGAHSIETIDTTTLVINVECYETGYEYGKRPSKIELWKVPSDKGNEAKLPQASLTIPSDNYEVGQDIGLELDIREEGDYTLDLSGAGIDREKTISSSQEINIEPSREGKIKANLSVDSDDWLLKEDSDLVSEASANVAENLPGASISYDPPSAAGLFVGQKPTVKFDFKEPGNYKISSKLNGEELVSEDIEAEAGETYTKEIRLSKSGNINSKVVAPSGFWVFGSDEVVASDTANVEQLPTDTVKPNVGETVNISISEDEVIEFRDTYIEAEHTYKTRSTHQRDPSAKDGVNVNVLRGTGAHNIDPNYVLTLQTYQRMFEVKLCDFERISEGDYAEFAIAEGGTSLEEMRSLCETESSTEESNQNKNSEGDTDQPFMCEEYDVKSNEFKFCNPGTKNIEIGDQEYEAEFWFVNKESGMHPTAEIDFKDSSTFMQLRPRSSTQVNGEAPTKNGYNLYLKEHSGADSQSPDDDSMVVEYIRDSEEPTDSTDEDTDPENSDEENRGSIKLSLGRDEISVGEQLSIEGEVPESTTETYNLIIKNPSDETLKQEEKTETDFTTAYVPREKMESGQYKVQLVPAGGLLESIMRGITGSETLKEKTFTLNNPNIPRWMQYCETQDYNTEQISQKVNCIKQEIIPKYFQESTGSNPEIGESLCQDLLSYQYSPEQRRCVTE